jgi:hypothetical protein
VKGIGIRTLTEALDTFRQTASGVANAPRGGEARLGALPDLNRLRYSRFARRECTDGVAGETPRRGAIWITPMSGLGSSALAASMSSSVSIFTEQLSGAVTDRNHPL